MASNTLKVPTPVYWGFRVFLKIEILKFEKVNLFR